MTPVPRERLLLLGAITLLTPAALWAAAPGNAVPLLLVVAAAVLLAAGDAVLGQRRCGGIEMLFPRRVALAKGREGRFTLEVSHGGTGLVLAPRFPSQMHSPVSEASVGAGEPRAVVSFPVTCRERGDWPLGSVRFRVPSPLGLWWLQGERTGDGVFSVHVDLGPERKQLAPYFLPRSELRIHPRRQVGQGREFEKLRSYLPGDSLADIHWKATAKRGHPVTKEFRIERSQEIYALVDASRLSGRLTPEGEPLLDRFVTAALALGLVATGQGDLFGVGGFAASLGGFVRAGNGPVHFQLCRDALHRLRPEAGNADFPQLAAGLSPRLRRRALLVIFTSLDEPGLGDEFVRSMRLLSRRHLVVVAMLRPPAATPAFTEPAREDDDLYRILGGHLLWQDLRELHETLRRSGIDLALLENERLAPDVVSRYVEVKRRQLL